MRVDAVVAKTKFIDQCGGEGVGFADRHAAVGIVLIACREAATVQEVGKWAGGEDRLVFVAEANEKIILVAEPVVNPNIKIVLIEMLLGINQVVVAADAEASERSGKQSCDS